MAQIDELSIDITADGSQAKKELKSVEDATKKSADGFAKIGEQLSVLAKAYVGFQALKNLTFDFAQSTLALADKTALLGTSVSSVDALGGALKRFGGSTEDAVSSLNSLQSAMTEAKRGGGALIEVAKRWGVYTSPFQSTEDALISLGKQMGRFSVQQRVAIGRQLGLSDSLLRAFADGGDELERMINKQKELGTITEEDVKISTKFNNAWLDLQDIFGAIRRDIARFLLPIVTSFLNVFTGFFEWVRQHKIAVLAFFGALATIFAVGLIPKVLLFAKVLKTSLLLASPFLKLFAIITTIALVFEDLYYYSQGWDSATGELLKKFPGLKPLIEPLVKIVTKIVDIFKKIVAYLENPSWDNFKAIIASIGEGIKEALLAPFDILSEGVDLLLQKFPQFAPILKPVKVVLESIKDIILMCVDGWSKLISAIGDFNLDGLKNGFSSLTDDISNSISSGVSKGWESTKSFFGFGSDKKKQAPAPAYAMVDNKSTNQQNINNLKALNAMKIQQAPAPTPQIPHSNNTINNHDNSKGGDKITNNITIKQEVKTDNPKVVADKAQGALIASLNTQNTARGRL